MKTNQSLNHGSVKSSTPSQKFKNSESSSKKNEQISKYFISSKSSKEDFIGSQNCVQLESPYKKSLSQIKYVCQSNDLDKDFRTPKPIKVQKKVQNKKTVSIKQNKPKSMVRKSKSKSTNRNSIFKATQDNFGVLDMNPEHLQMAIALSKSTYSVEYPELSKESEDAFPTFLTPEKIPKGKTTLERYGFKSDKPKLYAELRREPLEVPKKHKNSKFRFITPTLKTRTADERASIIASKMSLILCCSRNSSEELLEVRNQSVDELCSDKLKKFKGKFSVFAANGFSSEENDKYYNKDLNLSPTKSKCGCLLKKWEEIPGREKSPIRSQFQFEQTCDIKNTPTISVSYVEETEKLDFQINNQVDSEDLHNVSRNKISPLQNSPRDYSKSRNCISPDLFESDTESEFKSKSPDLIDDFSQSLLSPFKKQQKPQSENIETHNMPKYLSFDSDSSIELIEDDNTEDIDMSLSQKSSSSAKKKTSMTPIKNIPPCFEDEDTEELFLNSLKSQAKFPVNFTQNSPIKNYNEDVTEKLSPKDKCDTESHIKSQKEEFFVDLTLSSSSNDSSNCSTDKINTNGSLNTELTEKNLNTNTNGRDSDVNFEMSPLHVKETGDLFEETEFTTTFPKKSTSLQNIENGRRSTKTPLGISFELKYLDDDNASLNVTDYVHHILNQNQSELDEGISNGSPTNKSYIGENNSSSKIVRDSPKDDLRDNREDSDLKRNDYDDDNELFCSQGSCSQESIVISDEELNYSSIHSKNTKYNKCFYNLSDVEEICENNENQRDLIDMDEIYNVHSALQSKYGSKNISTPVHTRISELRGSSSLKKTSLTKEFQEDSFNCLIENSNALRELENKANEETVINPSPSKITESTPEKDIKMSTDDNTTTPENNLIIKTKNITPLANYDEMDTPRITKELEKFGLKPLKRRRGVKLLKYLYECTHPLVGPDEVQELSSEEDDQDRVVKKRKKSNGNGSGVESVRIREDTFRSDGDNIEIIGDALLENENFENLIFERKYSVRVHSCRVPLQIVWHNFLSKNSQVKENILLYEPLQLEVLHAMIKEQTGCKFHIQDLLTFFDRKCITIRTAQGSQRKQKT